MRARYLTRFCLRIGLAFILLAVFHTIQGREVDNAVKWADELSRWLHSLFESATKANEISKLYANLAEMEVFDPEEELRDVKRQIEVYLRQRAKMAWDAKVSLESNDLTSEKSDETTQMNNNSSKFFIRYFNVKQESDGTTVFLDGHQVTPIEVPPSRQYTLRPNPNFYQLPTTSDTSAVHIPTPLYNRDLYLLRRIKWSQIDQLYRKNREHLKDLWFQKFCSESGFMRFFPAASWSLDSREAELDLFDCRNTEWYVDAASPTKNVVVMLDMSGSMLGQRLEIARQTIESIFNTLSDNDYVNILSFSKVTSFIEDCQSPFIPRTEKNAEAGELVQATVRNKKILLGRLSNISAEGKAEYEKALIRTFSTLMNLPMDPSSVSWRTRDEVLRENAQRTEPPKGVNYIPIGAEHLLVVSDDYLQKIQDFAGNSQNMGCQDIIILITDGAPSNFKEIFDTYNKQKRVRMFSFVIGEEVAKDFEHIRWMSCNNRGFMSHIKGMGDVQDKVHEYTKVLARTVLKQSAAIHQENAVWSTSTRERMSDEFVVSVGYPVVLDDEFMGVASISVPLMELAQMAHPSLVGPRSHFFLLDKHGYVLFDPQLRPIDSNTNEIRPTFNNMPFADLVQATTNLNKFPRLECQEGTSSSGKPQIHLDSMFALENLKRVYPQRNGYHVMCLEGTPFSLALAVATNDNIRLRRSKQLGLKHIDLGWFRDENWRLHPRWRYCSLNDSDGDLSPEEGFSIYARQMLAAGQFPATCRSRKKLVDRLLLDIQATTTLRDLWAQDWKQNHKNGVHLTFFSTPSGLNRFMNRSLGEHYHNEPPRPPLPPSTTTPASIDTSNTSNSTTVSTTPSGPSEDQSASGKASEQTYKHFILELNKNTIEDDYYRRAVRQPQAPDSRSSSGRLVVELNPRTRLWMNASEAPSSAYGHKENETVLAMAYRSVHLDGQRRLDKSTVLGVAGVEFLFDKMVEHLSRIGCNPENDRVRCYLLDEHAYIVYSNQKDTLYSEYLSTANQPQNQGSVRKRKQQQQQQLKKMFADPHHAFRASDQQNTGGGYKPVVPGPSPNVVMGRFFGHINRVTEWAMEMLIKKGFYTETRFVDGQAMCDEGVKSAATAAPSTSAPTIPVAASASVRTMATTGFYAIFGWFLGLLAQVSLFPAKLVEAGWSGGWAPVARTASLFRPSEGLHPCRQTSIYYLANYDNDAGVKTHNGALIEEHLSERPCRQSAAQCAVKLFASWVKDTNLLLLIVRQNARSQCYEEAHCPLSNPPSVPFGVIHQEKVEPQESSDAAVSKRIMEEEGTNEAANDRWKYENCLTSRATTKRRNAQCLRDDVLEDDAEQICSAAAVLSIGFSLLSCLISFFFLYHVFVF